MIFSIRNTFLLHRKVINGDSSTTHFLYSLLLQNPSPLFPKSFSSSSKNESISSSPFVVSYLINSCGFSKDKAISASKKLHFKTSSQPDSVISFLENNGFTKPYIFKLINRLPQILSSDPLKTLKPKFDFFYSIGLSGPDLAKIVTDGPVLLRRSLEKQLIPSFTFLKNTLQTNDNVIAALKRSSSVLQGFDKKLVPNIKLLQNHNVPQSNINHLLITQPRALMVNVDLFQKIVMDLKEMDFDLSKSTFLLAIHGLTSMSKSTWESKLNVYRKWGWSEDEIRMAFRKQPYCMTVSEKKITAIMDFLVNKMGNNSSLLAKHPSLLMLSLKKRIIPRYLFLQVLISKGLIDKDFKIRYVLSMSEDSFLNKYVFKYGDEAPQLLKAYQGQ